MNRSSGGGGSKNNSRSKKSYKLSPSQFHSNCSYRDILEQKTNEPSNMRLMCPMT